MPNKISPINKTNQLKCLEIKNLFYKYNYNIPLKDDRITILTGINGSGKTNILKIFDCLFGKKISQLMSISFDSLKLDFENECTLKIYKNRFIFNKNCIERGDDKYLGFIDFKKNYYDFERHIEIQFKEESSSGLIFEYENNKSKKDLFIYEFPEKPKFNNPHRGWIKIEPNNKNNLKKISAEQREKYSQAMENFYYHSFEKAYRESNQSKESSFNQFYDLTSLKEDVLSEQIIRLNTEMAYTLGFFEGESQENQNLYPDSEKVNELGLKQFALNCIRSGINPGFVFGEPIIYGKGAEEDPPFIYLFNDISTHFIETNRIFKPLSSEYYDDQLKTNSNSLKEKIKKANAKYNEISQEKDKTFVSRLLKISKGSSYLDKDQLKSKLDKASKDRKKLYEQGILKDDTPATISIPLIDKNLDKYPKNYPALSLHIDDINAKFEPFLEVSEKFGIFTKIFEKFLKNKTVELSQTDGIVLFDNENRPDNQKPLKIFPEQLSSGEKHIMIILFDFIFNIPKSCLILIDEPELSLHVSWQREFIRSIKEMIDSPEKENVMVIIATHSPQIIHNRRDLIVQLGGVKNNG